MPACGVRSDTCYVTCERYAGRAELLAAIEVIKPRLNVERFDVAADGK
ncbi:hypothetical protein RSSM_00998 [Rhodopirellula sallentina SM41]|uniref:Uncharacterized protein n=1 Tax=Rhodopirellula sallentina SM41 TaxID=1263870 RepID=M5UI88_9BACT|nr:hypothetical protein RSSM_00998 [Rhodopirellula sallentina SM41]